MIPYVAGEDGKGIRFDADFDITGVTKITIDVERPDESKFTSDVVTIGIVDVKTEYGIFKAYQYSIYVTKAGDFPEHLNGRYYVKLTYDFGSVRSLKTQSFLMEVAP